jgi:DnaK suppressor protein
MIGKRLTDKKICDLWQALNELDDGEKKPMIKTDLETFRTVLRAKLQELAGNSRRLESIAVERSPDMLEELQYKADRELAIVGFTRDSSIRRDIELALTRIDDGTFGSCLHCEQEISSRRLEAVPWTPFCVRCQEAADCGDVSVLERIAPMFLDAA